MFESESDVTQSCPTLCDPSLPGSSVHRIFQASVREWVATSFSMNLYCLYIFMNEGVITKMGISFAFSNSLWNSVVRTDSCLTYILVLTVL